MKNEINKDPLDIIQEDIGNDNSKLLIFIYLFSTIIKEAYLFMLFMKFTS